ncbi:hypothetical protein GCM10011609_35160 [Lentzea pudingi]|uniref:ANTAR domain-containing protein n=1 Tax=Lentzea pudingi TaxID=1789439 RepID=A0ABQ2HZS3_9PSEU|nr:hypothetical protein GCM10011609_35160 [Lentzea pudingi]
MGTGLAATTSASRLAGPRLTAQQCLWTALRLHGKNADADHIRDLLDRVGLGAREAGTRP